MHASADCEDDLCSAPGFGKHSALSTFVALSPFIVTFVAAFVVVQQRIFPQLSRIQNSRDGEDHYLPSDAPLALQQAHAEHGSKSVRRRVAAVTFATTVALATVLGELILCEISDLVNPYARGVALRFTVPTLLFLLVVLIPFLELQSVISGSGWSFQRTSKGRLPKIPWMIQFGLFGLWLFGFWSLGSLVPLSSEIVTASSRNAAPQQSGNPNGLARACLERIGVIGISLMALLSGFASVSSPWHTFGSRASRRPVTEADVARKQAGLDATNEMLVTKRHRLRQLQRKAAENPASSKSGFLSKMVGNIRGGGDAAEMRSLKMEIVGLEAMESNLSTSLSALRARQVNTARARTTVGKLFLLPTYVFSIYCLYRIAATTLTTIRRLYYPASSFSSSDPINR
ncbi:hypothetical protein Micbo1qcDRAFT_159652, partial [Microdochium bolleyi]